MPNNNKNELGGSSHDRRIRHRHDDVAGAPHAKAKTVKLTASESGRQATSESAQRRNDLFNLIGFALGCASWGWTVLAPESSTVFGSVLLFLAVMVGLLGIWRVWAGRKIWYGVVVLIAIASFVAFDWFIVVKPQRGKPYRDLLVEGYHLVNECQTIPANDEMPAWIRDQSKSWQSRVQQRIEEKLSGTDAQTWQSAIVVGTIADERMNGYQCLWLSNKVAALEKIVSANFEASLKHRDQIAPTFWLNAVNGEVDMTQVLNSGIPGAGVYINGGGAGMVKIKGKAPIKNGTVRFDLQPPP
jgi:hypothetical protein